MDRLSQVTAPTLLIVGGDGVVVLQLNRAAAGQMQSTYRLEVVTGASHLFDERGTLEAVAHLARDWFVDKFAER